MTKTPTPASHAVNTAPFAADLRGIEQPEIGTHAFNKACWAFVNQMPHQLPGPIFNELKPAVHAAICEYLRQTAGAAPASPAQQDAPTAQEHRPNWLPFSVRTQIAARHGTKVTAAFNKLVRDVIETYLATHASAPAQAQQDAPAARLAKPARVGGGTFGVGVDERLVIEAAQRHYENERAREAFTPQQLVEEERKRRALWDLVHGALDAPAAVAVPAAQVDAIGAALELESRAKTVESQTTERAMLHAANCLRLLAAAPAAPAAPASQDAQDAPMVDMQPPATRRDRWMYEQGRLAERDARTPGSVGAALTQAARDVLAERARQIGAEGYDPEHDDAHDMGEIGALAALYLMPQGAREWDASSTGYGATLGEALLPADWSMPRMGDDPRQDLVKGAACGLAELERFDRAAARAAQGGRDA